MRYCIALVLCCALLADDVAAASSASLQQLLERVERVKAKLKMQYEPRLHPRIAQGEELFLSAYKGNLYLGEIIAVTAKQGVYVELLSLLSALQFAVTPNALGNYEGWFFAPENHFFFDLERGIVESRGQKTQLNESEFYVANGEVFVAEHLIAALFEVKLAVNLAELAVTVSSEQQLPAELQQQRRGREAVSVNRHTKATLPWRPSPYQKLGRAVLDAQINTVINSNSRRSSYSVLGSQDIAYWQAKYFFAGDESELLRRSRVSLNRSSEKGQVVPFAGVTSLTVGDIQGVQVGANAVIAQGRGIRLTNAPLKTSINQQRIVISGPVQAGWDVELYRNGLLIAQQNDVQSGRYEFENTDLLLGENTFEVVMYGGQGQVAREVQTYYVEQGNATAGQGYFQASLSQLGKSVLGSHESNKRDSGWQINGRFDYGLTPNVGVYAGMQWSTEREDEASQYWTAGLNANINKQLLLDVDFLNNRHQHSIEGSARTKLMGQQLRASASLTKNRQRELSATEFQLAASGSFAPLALPKLFYSAEYSQQKSFLGRRSEQASLLLTSGNYWGTFSNRLAWQRQANSAADINGYFRWQRRVFDIYSRFTAWYETKPDTELSAVELELSKDLTNNIDVGLTLYDDLLVDYQQAELGFSWSHEKFRLLGEVEYDSNREWQLGLSGQLSIGAGQSQQSVFLSARRLSQAGSLMVHAYLDENNNGHRDSGERPLPGVVVRARQNYAQGKTDSHGMALLPNMVNYKRTDIVVDEAMIPEPFIVPASAGFSFTPRPGFVEYVEIPFVNASEIEGVVTQTTPQGGEALGFVTVELRDQAGETVAQTQAAYDGYYFFTDLKPGTYRAAIKGAELRGMSSESQVEVTLGAGGDVLLGVDHRLQPLSAKTSDFAVAGRFKTLKILNVYAALLEQRYAGVIKHGFSFAKQRRQQEYLLIINHGERTGAAKLCQQLSAFKVACSVEQLTYYEGTKDVSA